jgi:hypothetical protein
MESMSSARIPAQQECSFANSLSYHEQNILQIIYKSLNVFQLLVIFCIVILTVTEGNCMDYIYYLQDKISNLVDKVK